MLGFVLLMFDVGARKEAENASQESHNLLRHVIDTIPAAINLKDLDGRLILTNAIWLGSTTCRSNKWKAEPTPMFRSGSVICPK